MGYRGCKQSYCLIPLPVPLPSLVSMPSSWHWRVSSRPAGIGVCLNDICGGYGRGWHQDCPWLCLGVWMGSVTLRHVSCRSRQNQSLAGIRCSTVPGLGGRTGFKFLPVTSAAVVTIPVPAWVSGPWDKEGAQRRPGQKTRTILAEAGNPPPQRHRTQSISALGGPEMLLPGWFAILSTWEGKQADYVPGTWSIKQDLKARPCHLPSGDTIVD